jgi:2-polyprenyl-3-methyl-5-hydroxy-6-metoxy-1,4-benzoquinol methylase
MNCHCCKNGVYKMLVYEDCFKCSDCGHVYRQFYGDIEDYHREKYREEHPTYPLDERERYCKTLYNFFEEYVGEDSSLLEVGCGDGFLANMVQPHVKEMTGLEIDPKLVKGMNETYPELKTIECSFLDYEGEAFDMVYAIDVLEHADDVESFANKLREATKKYVLIQIPTKRRLKKPNPIFDGHSHYFTKESLEHLFKGFKLIKHRITNQYETSRGQSFLALFEIV